MRTIKSIAARRAPLLACIAFAFAAALAPASASAMQVLDAVDHAELGARVSATSVSRIALVDDRIARVIRAPGRFETEHDPGSGDLYLRPLGVDAATGDEGDAWGGDDGGAASVALFIGTEKGFTYRLTLTVAERAPAQILIRNADAMADRSGRAERPAAAGEVRVGALVALVRAVARREPPAGFAIAAAGSGGGTRAGVPGTAAVRWIETWRGPRFEARVVEIPEEMFAGGTLADAAGIAARLGPGSLSGTDPGIAAAWLAGPGTGPHGGRIAVLVRESARSSTGDPR